MTENEPLNAQHFANERIVPLDVRPGVQPSTLVNDICKHKNGTKSNCKDRNGSNTSNPVATHIEAPCCRDIHGNEPPDGGVRAWLVMLSAFLCNGVIFGIINVYGVIHALLTDRLTEQGDTEASSKAALVGSLTIGTTFLLSPVAGVLTDKIGLRLTTFIGGVFSAGGLLLSSFFTQNIAVLYLTYGIMFGFGAALAYTPTLAILGHYFKRYLGKVSGFVTAGSSVFTVILPVSLDRLLKGYGLETTLQVMSLISTFIIVCSFVYKPLHQPPEPPMKKPGRSRVNLLLRSLINVDIWKRKKYVIWALSVPLALFGYFVPYVHMMKFVQTVFPGESENLPVMCIGITSGLGRLIFGVIADLPGVNRIYLQQLSLTCIGLVTLCLPLTSSYVLLVIFALIMGLFDGCFISLIGPIAYEICGPSGATQAIGFLLGFSSLPLTVGPPIAGKIFDSTGSYTIPFILAGLPPLIGSSVMFLIRCVRDEDSNIGNGNTSGSVGNNNDIECVSNGNVAVPLINGHTAAGPDNHSSSETNGKARLADTGTDTLPAPSGISSALYKLKNNFTACACVHQSSSSLTNNTSTSSKTALLTRSTSCMSSTLLGNSSFGHSDDLQPKRRYTYSIY